MAVGSIFDDLGRLFPNSSLVGKLLMFALRGYLLLSAALSRIVRQARVQVANPGRAAAVGSICKVSGCTTAIGSICDDLVRLFPS